MYRVHEQEVRQNKWGRRNKWRSKQTFVRRKKENTTVKAFVDW